jgi:hypothetical protein
VQNGENSELRSDFVLCITSRRIEAQSDARASDTASGSSPNHDRPFFGRKLASTCKGVGAFFGWRRIKPPQPQRGESKKFHLRVEKSPCSRRVIVLMTRTIRPSESTGAIMTIMYVAATVFAGGIVWGVLGLLLKEI